MVRSRAIFPRSPFLGVKNKQTTLPCQISHSIGHLYYCAADFSSWVMKKYAIFLLNVSLLLPWRVFGEPTANPFTCSLRLTDFKSMPCQRSRLLEVPSEEAVPGNFVKMPSPGLHPRLCNGGTSGSALPSLRWRSCHLSAAGGQLPFTHWSQSPTWLWNRCFICNVSEWPFWTKRFISRDTSSFTVGFSAWH